MEIWDSQIKDKKFKRPKGKVIVIEDRCKGCGFCIEFCPKDVLAASEEYNKRGVHPPVVVNPDDCINCKQCEYICPDFAIYVEDWTEEGDAEEEKQKKRVKGAS